MAIKCLSVSNFKGIEGLTDFELKPITVFVGGNSSGKSSCLHALASLAQTIKLGNSIPALILDDDYAQVHLGRFVEIAHSRNYRLPIHLAINVGHVQMAIHKSEYSGDCTAKYAFKCSKDTEEIYIDTAELVIGDSWIKFKKKANSDQYVVTSNIHTSKLVGTRKTNFFFAVTPPQTDPSDWIEILFLVDAIQRVIESNLRQTMYLGPFRQSPLRRYPFRGSTANEVGAQGEATITMLASEYVQSSDKSHLSQINEWLSTLGLAKNVGVKRVGSSDLFDVSLTLTDDKDLPIADLGYGLSQVLPVLTQCSFAAKGSTLMFEQPELHLHEGAAKKLSQVFLETSKIKKSNILIETHSKELIYELFEMIKSGDLDIEDIAIYSVKREGGKSNYDRVKMHFDEDGRFEVENDNPWFKTLS
ncbi:AAA family ATPase [Methylophilus sp. YYY-1]|uniref:AAA family ATPase n=1 Tax=Methylophilus sp. YYY-1 TaxID=2682087 RepID=UPI0023B208F7|nr:AAA family ATPase [Methylophilus sp. YYY-1]MDF0379314.1 AAA family ATPase [Methylophilus sp. YYY-1]